MRLKTSAFIYICHVQREEKHIRQLLICQNIFYDVEIICQRCLFADQIHNYNLQYSQHIMLEIILALKSISTIST